VKGGGLVRRAQLGTNRATRWREKRASLEGIGGNSQAILLARRTRTMKLCSSDARSEGQPGHSLARGYTKIGQKNALDTRSGRPPSPLSREKKDGRAVVARCAQSGATSTALFNRCLSKEGVALERQVRGLPRLSIWRRKAASSEGVFGFVFAQRKRLNPY
jgi:hypothetical protein